MQLFTIISLLIATSGAAYAVIAAIKEYTNAFVIAKIKTAKVHLQDTTPEKSANKELYSQARSNKKIGIVFVWAYRICFFLPITTFSYYVIKITVIVNKAGLSNEIITEKTWPTYKSMLFWAPVSYAIFIGLGLAFLAGMVICFRLLKNKSDVAGGKTTGAVSKTIQK